MTTTRVSDHIRDEWAKNKLWRLTPAGSPIEAFYLAVPRVDDSTKYYITQGCLILFTPEGIVITGDWCPENNRGACSNRSYGIEWFAKPLGEEYLCSKFLMTEYVKGTAIEYVKGRLKELRESIEGSDKIRVENLNSKIDLLQAALDDEEEGDFRSQESFCRLLDDAGDTDSCDAGDDYDPRDAEVLCAIQQRFVQAYAELRDHESKHCPGSRFWYAFYLDKLGSKLLLNAAPMIAATEAEAVSLAYKNIWYSKAMPEFREIFVEETGAESFLRGMASVLGIDDGSQSNATKRWRVFQWCGCGCKMVRGIVQASSKDEAINRVIGDVPDSPLRPHLLAEEIDP